MNEACCQLRRHQVATLGQGRARMTTSVAIIATAIAVTTRRMNMECGLRLEPSPRRAALRQDPVLILPK